MQLIYIQLGKSNHTPIHTPLGSTKVTIRNTRPMVEIDLATHREPTLRGPFRTGLPLVSFTMDIPRFLISSEWLSTYSVTSTTDTIGEEVLGFSVNHDSGP